MQSWERPYYSEPGGRPSLFYALFGDFGDLPPLSRSTYRSNGVPEGFDLMRYNRAGEPAALEVFCEGYLWDKLGRTNAALAAEVEASPSCFVLRGEVDDRPDLNYFRDALGLLTYLSDNGGACLFDPQMFEWWSPADWKAAVDDDEPGPERHTVILVSKEEGGDWYHTRGMRKFGRPDLSIRGVGPDQDEGVVEFFNRFIAFQALGGVIGEGQEVQVDGFPPGLTCHHSGDLDDPDFNNVHVEIRRG